MYSFGRDNLRTMSSTVSCGTRKVGDHANVRINFSYWMPITLRKSNDHSNVVSLYFDAIT
jgi:hypothetical protein